MSVRGTVPLACVLLLFAQGLGAAARTISSNAGDIPSDVIPTTQPPALRGPATAAVDTTPPKPDRRLDQTDDAAAALTLLLLMAAAQSGGTQAPAATTQRVAPAPGPAAPVFRTQPAATTGGGGCRGNPAGCSSFSDGALCRQHTGCYWRRRSGSSTTFQFEMRMGGPASCNSKTNAGACNAHRGCHWG